MTETIENDLRGLFIQLYFDEDISARIVDNLKNRGFNVVSARDMDMLHKDDESQITYSIAQKRAIVTHNRLDFEKLHQRSLETETRHYGIIIVKRRQNEHIVVARLLALLDSISSEEIENQLRYI